MPELPVTAGRTEIARYPYLDSSEKLVYEVVRYVKPDGTKYFRQCRPDGMGGTVWNLDGVVRVPYRLPQVLRSRTVYLVEGEKDVHTLEDWGLVASCNAGGSGSTRAHLHWTEYFQDRDLIILPDNDRPGREHAAGTASAYLKHAASIRILELPNLPPRGDVTDWANLGGTNDTLVRLADSVQVLDERELQKVLQRWGLSNGDNEEQLEPGCLVTRRMLDIRPERVSWLWPGKIARGKLTIIAGNPGLGKSQLMANLAAVVTTGGVWPIDGTRCDRGTVVFLSAEDDPADTLRPRLEAAGADLSRVHILENVVVGSTKSGQRLTRGFSLRSDVQELEKKLSDLGDVAMLAIDPITAYLGDVDTHKNSNVRAILAPLSELAARQESAVVTISHLNKATGTEALMRVTGSLGFVAAARAAYLVAADPDEKSRRLFLPIKNNLGSDVFGLSFHIEGATIATEDGTIETSRVIWDAEPITQTADEVLQTQTNPEQSSARREAEQWLREILSQPMPANDLKRAATEAGISARTLRRAFKSLGGVAEKDGMRGGWRWMLGPKMAKGSEDVHPSSVDTFGEAGRLRPETERQDEGKTEGEGGHIYRVKVAAACDECIVRDAF